MVLRLAKDAEEKAAHAILVSGSARSGTTILGKIIHSFQNVEYAFEPPEIISLLASINEVPSATWKMLYATNLYESLLMGSLSGRSINTNRYDDSSIFHVKGMSDIDSRLSRSHRKVELENRAMKSVIAYKIPDIIPFIPSLLDQYPLTRVVLIRREAVPTINSLMEKHWFSDENMSSNLVWPSYKKGMYSIPYWVKKRDFDLWVAMSELDRCAYYYIRMNEDVAKIPDRVDVSYEALLEHPDRVVAELAHKLGLEFGVKTAALIKDIRPMRSKCDREILDKLSPNLLSMIQKHIRFSDG